MKNKLSVSSFFGLCLIIILSVSVTLLVASFNNLKHSFLHLTNIDAKLILDGCSIKGITLECNANLDIDSSGVPYEIELIQLKMYNEKGEHMGSWATDSVTTVDSEFIISISDVQIFKYFEDDNFKIYLDGFVKVKFDIGKYGMKLNLPLETEVLDFERKE